MSGQEVRFESQDGAVVAVSGALTFSSVAAAWRTGEARIRELRPEWLDLAGVQRADSAGLACVLALLASGRQLQPELTVRDAPESLRALARVSGAEAWLV